MLGSTHLDARRVVLARARGRGTFVALQSQRIRSPRAAKDTFGYARAGVRDSSDTHVMIPTGWKPSFAVGLAALSLGTAAVPAAHATLGQLQASVPADQNQLRASLKTMPGERFTVHELQVPSGTTMREYVSPTGVVFGVAWQGPTMPDLRQLLGAYFDQYVAAASAKPSRRGPVVVQLPGLTVQSTGHMRSFSGKAYIPEAVPAGVAPEDIQ
jgi:hypothetical protein